MKIFFNGRIIKVDQKYIATLAPGVAEGRGVFETMRVCKGRIVFLEEHVRRLTKGLKTLKLRVPYTQQQLRRHLKRVISANGFKNARLRLAVWKNGRAYNTAIVGQAFNGYKVSGMKAVICSQPRLKTRYSHIKSMDYGCFRRALAEARARASDEAILLNRQGKLVEGSRSNVFYVKNNKLFTPAVKCGCLNGIIRQKVISLARQLRIPFRVVSAGPKSLASADEAFLTNSLMGLMPLTALEGRPIGRGCPGPVTKKLQAAYCSIMHSTCPSRLKSV